jgi:hypothetical protein
LEGSERGASLSHQIQHLVSLVECCWVAHGNSFSAIPPFRFLTGGL